MRDIDEILKMLNRYYDGVSTPSETAQLKDFFRKTKEIPADMAADAAIFRAMDAADTLRFRHGRSRHRSVASSGSQWLGDTQ